MSESGVARFYRIAAAALGWFAIGLQYWLIVKYKTEGDLASGAIRYFSYFTNLSNVLVALAMTLPWLAPETRAGRFFGALSVRTAILVYILIVAAIYHLILRQLWDPQGWERVADDIEHVAVPILYAVDWLVFVPKARLDYRAVTAWLVVPVIYAAWTLAHGAATGFYPYPFLNVTKLGYEQVLGNLGALVVVFTLVGIVLIAVGRWMGGTAEQSAAA